MAKKPLSRIDGHFWFAGDIGPGRIALLERIQETGSISAAARGAGMSYKAAWDAVDTMNNLTDAPLVARRTGGRCGGGTRLTAEGRQLVRVYRTAEGEFQAFLSRLGEGIEDFEHFYTLMRRLSMKTSARNTLAGRVKAMHRDAVNTEVALDLGGEELVAVITNTSAERLGLEPGAFAYALIKASWVILAPAGEGARTSARNRLCGKVADLLEGQVNTEVTLALAGSKRLTAVVTNDSIQNLGLAVGLPACALIKASHVILAVGEA